MSPVLDGATDFFSEENIFLTVGMMRVMLDDCVLVEMKDACLECQQNMTAAAEIIARHSDRASITLWNDVNRDPGYLHDMGALVRSNLKADV